MNITVTAEKIALPRRKQNTHKGDYGKCLIIAGSIGYTGAPCLAAHAAVRSGAGLVYLCVPEEIYTIAAVKNDEAMVFPLPSHGGMLSKKASGDVLRRLEGSSICLIGPGLGRSEDIDTIMCDVINSSRIPLVIDADGINAIAMNIDILRKAGCPIVLTPHEGEFSRLGWSLKDGREAAARSFAEEYGCILVLKGHQTVTAFPDGDVFLNTTGNAGMAKGGSGDVLAGMLAALIGQGIPLKEAVPTAVWLHGRAGDLAAKNLGEYSMNPWDIIEALPDAIRPVVR